MSKVIFVVSESEIDEVFPSMDWGAQGLRAYRFRSLKAVIQQVTRRGVFPDWLLIFQERSHQFSQTDWFQILRLSPLTRAIVIYGPWCMSEPRTGTSLPGTVRISWAQWRALGPCVAHYFRALTARLSKLPLTASDEEIHLAQAELAPPAFSNPESVQIAVIGERLQELFWVKNLLVKHRFHVNVWTPQEAAQNWRPVRVVCFDVMRTLEEERETIGGLVNYFQQSSTGPCQWIILAGFPVPQEFHSLGTEKPPFVLTKPTPVWSLLFCLHLAVAGSPARHIE